jgi:hypothetical protein
MNLHVAKKPSLKAELETPDRDDERARIENRKGGNRLIRICGKMPQPLKGIGSLALARLWRARRYSRPSEHLNIGPSDNRPAAPPPCCGLDFAFRLSPFAFSAPRASDHPNIRPSATSVRALRRLLRAPCAPCLGPLCGSTIRQPPCAPPPWPPVLRKSACWRSPLLSIGALTRRW